MASGSVGEENVDDKDPEAGSGENNTGEKDNKDDKGNKNEKPSMVEKSYADRLLKQKKIAEDELKALKVEKEQRENDEAKARGEHEKIAATERKKREESDAKLEQARENYRKRNLKSELRLQANKLGILDDDDVSLIDTAEAEWDDTDEPTNASDLVKKFKEAKPGKFKTENSNEVDKNEVRKRNEVSPRPGGPGKKTDVDAMKMDQKDADELWKTVGKTRV